MTTQTLQTLRANLRAARKALTSASKAYRDAPFGTPERAEAQQAWWDACAHRDRCESLARIEERREREGRVAA